MRLLASSRYFIFIAAFILIGATTKLIYGVLFELFVDDRLACLTGWRSTT